MAGPNAATDDGDDLERRRHLAPDTTLAILVRAANRGSDFSFGITLHVGGALVTGELVGGTTFWAEQAEHVRRTGVGTGVEAMASMMDEVARYYEEELGSGEDGADDADASRNLTPEAFIHLRNARTITSQGDVPSEGTFWRGRLAAVDGYSLGTTNRPPARSAV